MDEFLSRLGVQAVNYAMRCGISFASKHTLQQCSRLLKTVDDKAQRAELKALQRVLDSKVKIISPALDLIEFRSGRGNVFLENAATLARALHQDIVALGQRLERAASSEEASGGRWGRPGEEEELAAIARDITQLLGRINDDLPLLQLAITASGESLSPSLPPAISPSRLLQASMLLTVGDTQFCGDTRRPAQIGPSFTLSLYMLFQGHASPLSDGGSAARRRHPDSDQTAAYGFAQGQRRPIWQEVLHKCRVRLCRTHPDWEFDGRRGYRPRDERSQRRRSSAALNEYAYHLELVEDLDDGRAHGEDEHGFCAYDTMARAGIRESIPIRQIAKIFYTDTGRILNIGGENSLENNAVLLLKRDLSATSPGKGRFDAASSADGDDQDDMDRQLRTENDQDDMDRQLRTENDQDDMDRQLRAESEPPGADTNERALNVPDNTRWRLPPHLDPEWLALEVYADEVEDGEDDDADSDDADSDGSGSEATTADTPSKKPKAAEEQSLVERMQSVAVSPGTVARPVNAVGAGTPRPGEGREGRFTAQSPFGAVTSSLSLLEMLIRLTSLQEFQQTCHLAIPDHILTFFLEETSTTGLHGEERRQAKKAARQKVGFDPYTDSPGG